MFGGFPFGQPTFGDAPADVVLVPPPEVVTAEISYGAHVVVEVASMAIGVLVTPVVGTLMLVDQGSRAVNVKVD